jgi:hypothetical protein
VRSVIDTADGRSIDLAGAVAPDLYAELERTVSHRDRPALRCGTCHAGIYIQHGRRDRDALFGYHHHAAGCPVTFTIRRAAPMSDEHKRQAEYHAVAATRAGHCADLEVTTSGRTRVDVVVDGRYGFEIQRSALSRAAAVDRTARSVTAGLDTVAWFTGAPGSPPWSGHVPGYRAAARADGWTALPLPGSVTAAGLQMFEAARCGAGTMCPPACTRAARSGCGRHVPQLAPWRGVRVDDVVTGIAQGTISPVLYQGHVRLMPAASIGLFEELTGVPLRVSYDAGQPRTQALRPAPRTECDREPATLADTRFWCETCGRTHPLREHRHCRRAAS